MFSYLTLVIIFSFFYMIGIAILYFSKSHIKNIENSLYKTLVLTNIAGLVIQFLCEVVSYNPNVMESFGGIIILRLMLVYYILWFTLVIIYVIAISFKHTNLYNNITIILCVICSIISTFLPMELYADVESKVFHSSGMAVNFTFLVSGIMGGFLFLILIIKNKVIPKKKSTPIYIFLFLGLVAAVVQKLFPGVVILTCVESFICGMMYFTIENPDLKVIDELEANRRIVDQNNEAKSNLLFKLSQELRHPLKEIVDLSERLANSNNEDMRKLAAIINQNADKMYKYVNSVLDITSLDASHIKSYKTKYNIRDLMDEVVMLCRNKVKNKIDFQYDISLGVPNELYGDKIKIKQIIYSLIMNVLDYTDSGFVSLSLEAINKYDMSRLVFVIEDSGNSLPIEEVNNILSYDTPLTDKDLEKSVLSLPLVNKLIRTSDGSLIIKSLPHKGNSYTITIDQKNDLQKMTVQKSKEFKRVVIASSNDYLLEKTYKLLKKSFVVVSKSMYAQDVYDKLNNNEVIDYLIIDSELKNTDIVEFQKKVREMSQNNIKIFIILPFFQEKIKEKYKASGFDDYILFSDINNEIERIMKKE